MHQKDCKGLSVATPMPSSESRRALYGINRKRGLWVEEEAVDMSLKLHEVRGGSLDAWEVQIGSNQWLHDIPSDVTHW